jgi:hypothetical protein
VLLPPEMPKPDLRTTGEESWFMIAAIYIWLNHNIFIFCLAYFSILPTAYSVFLHLFIAFGLKSNMGLSDYLEFGREICGCKKGIFLWSPFF